MEGNFDSVYFENQGLIKLNKYINKLKPSKIIFLTDENTYKYCYPKIILDLNIEFQIHIIVIKSGENYKNINTCNYIWLKLIDYQVDRLSLMINLGGGVVTDIGGFVASTYMRGIKFINIPTTLLGMVDASIGGKTGIDVNFFKNLVGTFFFAEMVVIDFKFLYTLHDSQLKSGFAEMLKHTLISDKKQWNELKNIHYTEKDKLNKKIPQNILLKCKIVELDFKEKDIRQILNFGHTIGHALESYFLSIKKPILHGEAIAMGMLAESFIAKKINILSEDDFLEIQQYLLNIYTIYSFSTLDFKFLISFIKKDKKNRFDKFHFSLVNAIGNGVCNQEVFENDIIESFYYLINLKRNHGFHIV